MTGNAPAQTARPLTQWWRLANVIGLAAVLVWLAVSGYDREALVSGPVAGFGGIVLLSMAGESIYSKETALRHLKKPVTPTTHPFIFWFLNALQIVAAICCFFLI